VLVLGVQSVRSVELAGIGGSCDVNLMPLFNKEGEERAFGSTFGDLTRLSGEYRFVSGCLYMCGHTPITIDFEFDVYQSAAKTAVITGRTYIPEGDEQRFDTFYGFVDFLKSREGEDWVGYASYVQDQKYLPQAIEAFRNFEIDALKYEIR
jgi:hypothetical protein